MKEHKFNFWCPVEIQKSELDPITGKPKRMKLGGIASTADEDSDGEFLDPSGFDITPLVERGVVNWHHQAKTDPSAIIGEPVNVKIDKRGLYLEADLYPDSKVANDVYTLAQTLESNSKTRRLGFSIEGKVLERESDDKDNPKYNHVKKALITGVAITHMPKNPKTFANIIKGETDDFDDEEGEMETDVDVDTERGDTNVKYFTEGELFDKIFNDIPGISVEKAIQIENLITKISGMKKRMITEEDIEKAYGALGIDIEKSDDADELEKKEEETEEEEVEDNEDGEDTTEEEETETKTEKKPSKKDDIEEGCGTKVHKSRINTLEKAIATSHAINEKYFKALGSVTKGFNEKLDELTSIIKSQDDTINELRDAVEAFGAEVPAPKSISHARPVERAFQKSNDDEMNNGGANVLSISRDKRKIVDILDQATFAKGYDEQFSKACTQFESSGVMPMDVAKRLHTEFGIQITK